MPWHRRLVQSLLYGRNVDREPQGAGAARLGARRLCAWSTRIIALRLVLYAVLPDTHAVRRGGSQDAVATARPDIIDRNGEILATDLKTPSLFAEPRRIIDPDEATELLAGVMPDLDSREVRDRLGSQPRLRLAQARDHAGAAAGNASPRHSRRRLPDREQARLSQRQRGLAHHRLRQYRQPGHCRDREWLDSHGLADLHRAGFASDREQEPVRLAVDLRVQHAMRDELVAARDKFKADAAAGIVLDVRTGEVVSMVSVPDYDPNNPREALDPTGSTG